MKLIVGLGNPGKKYKDTKHNIGFDVIDEFIAREGLSLKLNKKFDAEVAMGDFEFEISVEEPKKKKEKVKTVEGTAEQPLENKEKPKIEPQELIQIKEQAVLAMPQTFMNLSGVAVSKIVNFYKIKIEDILVVHDDVSLDFGKMRLSFNRGAGGQHGVEDIMGRLGNAKKFYRLRVGIGPDPGGDMRADYVLSKFTNKEKRILEDLMPRSIEAVNDWLAYFGVGKDLKKQERIIEKYNTKVL